MFEIEKTVLFTRVRHLTGEMSKEFYATFGGRANSFELDEPLEHNSFRPFNCFHIPMSRGVGATNEHVINIDSVTQIFIKVNGDGKVLGASTNGVDVDYFSVPASHEFMNYVRLKVTLAYLLGNEVPPGHVSFKSTKDED